MASKPKDYGRTPLHLAVIDGKSDEASLLIKGGADLSAQDENGFTPLHFAAQSQNSELAQTLLQAGADIDRQDIHGNTPLWRAVFNYRDEGDIIQILLSHGADPEIQNKSGTSPRLLSSRIANYDAKRYFQKS